MFFRHKKLVATLALASQGLGGFGGFAAKAGAAEASDEAAETVVSSGVDRNEADSDSVPLPETGDETGLDSRLLPHGAKLGIHIAGVGLIAGITAIATRGFGLLCEKNKDTIGSHEQLPDQQSENNVMRNIELMMTNQADGKICDSLESVFEIKFDKTNPSNLLKAMQICAFGPNGSGIYRLMCKLTDYRNPPSASEEMHLELSNTFLKYRDLLVLLCMIPPNVQMSESITSVYLSCLGLCVFSKSTDAAHVLTYIEAFRKEAPSAGIVLVETNYGLNKNKVSTVHDIVKLLDESNFPRERLFYYTADLDSDTSQRVELPETT